MANKLFDPIRELVVQRVKDRGRPYKVGFILSAGDFPVMGSLKIPLQQGWVSPVLYGDEDLLRNALARFNFNIGDFIIADAVDRESRVTTLIESVEAGGLDALCFGADAMLRNFKFLRKSEKNFFNSELGTCGIAALAFPNREKLLWVADMAVRPEPDVDQLEKITRHLVNTLLKSGIDKPRVGMLSAVEVKNPGMPSTMVAAEVADRFTDDNVFVEGPISLDIAVNKMAAEKKKAKGEVAGQADGIIGPNLTVSRTIYQSAVTLCGAQAGSVMVGGMTPVALAGRADGAERLALSTLLAVALVD